MSRTNARTGKGTTLSYCATANGSFIPVVELKSVGLPEKLAPTTGATHYGSDNEEKITTGYQDVSDVPFTYAYTDEEFAVVDALVGVEKYFLVNTPQGGEFLFLGTITAHGGGDIPMKEAMPVSGKITALEVYSFSNGT